MTERTHEEKLQLLREIKERAEADTKRLQELLEWFREQTSRKKPI